MQTFRKFLTGFFSIILYVLLIAGATAATITLVFAQPDSLESMLVQSKLYDNFVDNALQQANESNKNDNSGGGISTSDEAVVAAAKEAFAPAMLQKNVNNVIEANYAWLKGKTDKPVFVVDLSDAKKTFATEVGKAVTTHLASLPVCTTAQLSTLSYDQADPLTVTCRPATISPAAEGAKVTAKLLSSDGFLDKTVYTADTLSEQGDPYYKKAAFAPQIYRYATYSPYILFSAALIVSLIIIFVAVRKRNGLRAVSIVLLISGIVLIGTYFAAAVAYTKYHTQLFNHADVGPIEKSLTEFLHHLQVRLSQDYLYIGIAFVALALLGFVILLATRNRRKPTDQKQHHIAGEQSIQKTVPTVEQSGPQRPVTTAPTLRTPSRPAPSSSAPKPKRPKLIQ